MTIYTKTEVTKNDDSSRRGKEESEPGSRKSSLNVSTTDIWGQGGLCWGQPCVLHATIASLTSTLETEVASHPSVSLQLAGWAARPENRSHLQSPQLRVRGKIH